MDKSSCLILSNKVINNETITSDEVYDLLTTYLTDIDKADLIDKIPIFINYSNRAFLSKAIEQALKYYQDKFTINSVLSKQDALGLRKPILYFI